jgi:hypothetical protein
MVVGSFISGTQQKKTRATISQRLYHQGFPTRFSAPPVRRHHSHDKYRSKN